VTPEAGVVTRNLLSIARDGSGDRRLAEKICHFCLEGLDVDGASISLLTATVARETLWATDAVADLLEDLQFTMNEGACMQAATTGAAVAVADLFRTSDTTAWPMFAAAVAERTPIRALFALPLRWGTVNIGVLDLYRRTPGVLSPVQWQDALTAADTAALMMLGQRTDPGDHAGSWLDHPLGHRAEIHQATGMVLAQLGISAADALARLRAHAFVEQRLLIDVARDVVARRLTLIPDEK
jgi:GAF domain-containing protein